MTTEVVPQVESDHKDPSGHPRLFKAAGWGRFPKGLGRSMSIFLRHGGFPPKTSSQTAHNARFLEGQPREWNPYKKIMPL